MNIHTCPKVICETLLPNMAVLNVSPLDEASGAMCMNIMAFAWPDRESWSSWVSFELRYGTWLDFAANADITSPRALKLLLMCLASSSLSPVATKLGHIIITATTQSTRRLKKPPYQSLRF